MSDIEQFYVYGEEIRSLDWVKQIALRLKELVNTSITTARPQTQEELDIVTKAERNACIMIYALTGDAIWKPSSNLLERRKEVIPVECPHNFVFIRQEESNIQSDYNPLYLIEDLYHCTHCLAYRRVRLREETPSRESFGKRNIVKRYPLVTG